MPRDFLAAFFLCLLAFTVYQSVGTPLYTIDSFGSRHLAASLANGRGVDLSHFAQVHLGDGYVWGVGEHDGSVRLIYPIGPSIIATPFYLFFRLLGVKFGGEDLVAIEWYAASAIMAVAVGLCFLLIRRCASLWWALGLAVVYGFGTANWVLSSKALWQHGPSQLALLAALVFLTSPTRRWWILACGGLGIGFYFLCRPPNSIAIAVLGFWILFRYWKDIRAYLAVGLPALACLVFYLVANKVFFGSVRGGYYQFHGIDEMLLQSFSANGAAATLFSPALGLFIYAPIFLLSLVAPLLLRWRGSLPALPEQGLMLVGAASLVLMWLFYACFGCWWAGESVVWGPRFLLDVHPFLILMVVPFIRTDWIPRFAKVAPVAVLGLIGIGINGIGAARHCTSYGMAVSFDARRESLVWSFPESPINFALTQGNTPQLRSGVPPLIPTNTRIPMSTDAPEGLLHATFHKPESWGVHAAHLVSRIRFRAEDDFTAVNLAMHPRRAQVTVYLDGIKAAVIKPDDVRDIPAIYRIPVPQGINMSADSHHEIRVVSDLRIPYLADSADQRRMPVSFLGFELSSP